MDKRKICVVTGTRADYGLLFWIMRELQQSSDFQLQIIATGMHLSPEFGLTYRQIEEDGFQIDAKVEMLLSSDTSVGITKSVGLATIGFADAYDRLKPDIVLLLGDRFEILAAAQAAMLAKTPIAHLSGGDTTEGAFDEAIRHSITKMSHLHFVTNEQSAKRVFQLGENPEYVFDFGSTGVEYIKRVKLLSKKQLEEDLDFKFQETNFLVTFHPTTLDLEKPKIQFQQLLDALDHFKEKAGIIITKPNSDTDGRELINMIDQYVLTRPNARAYTSLGQLRYLSAINHVNVVIGNSSSGITEVPSFRKPTVNIGERQKGRLQATSILNCDANCQQIISTIYKALDMDCSNVVNPYGQGDTSARIIHVLRSIPDYQALLKKRFYEVSTHEQ